MSELSGKIQTVCGLIEPSVLGPTLMHEHVVCDFTPPGDRATAEQAADITLENVWETGRNWVETPGNRRILDHEVAIREMNRMVESGGSSVVDVSTHPMILDPDGLRHVSELTGVHIICGSGRYTEEFMTPEDIRRSVDELTADIVDDITIGVRKTGVRAGIIGEVGCSWPWTEAERRSVEAGVNAQKETGSALSIHPGRHPQGPFEVVSFARTSGADISRTIIDHIERRISVVEDILRLADTGCVLEFDLFGMEATYFNNGKVIEMPSDSTRLRIIRNLIDAGHGDRILMSHDVCTRTRQVEFGGHGYGHIFRNVIPMMRHMDFSADEIETILVKNPARLLTFN